MKFFNEFKQAKAYAQKIAITLGTSIRLGRKGDTFFVEDGSLKTGGVTEDLSGKKFKILKAIKNKTLSLEQATAVLLNKLRYSFSKPEIAMIEGYKNNLVRSVGPATVCMQCGMVGNNCTCGRSWY